MNGKTHSWLGLGPNTVLHAVSDENSLSKVGSSLDTVESMSFCSFPKISTYVIVEFFDEDSVGLAGDSSSCGVSAFGDVGADATVED